jgi:hypothetical protein
MTKLGGARFEGAANHSLLKIPRAQDDLAVTGLSRLDIWKYQYKDPVTGKIITDSKPISSRKEFWKTKQEARIIALTLFGNIQKFLLLC